MRVNVVFTLTGADRIGIVETVTKTLLEHGGNVETSRMARLGGEFAILMLVSLPSDQLASLDRDLVYLTAQDYKVSTQVTEYAETERYPGWLPYEIRVEGADHEGIIHQVAHSLSQRGITIESLDTETTQAPESGTPVFSMTALVLVPPTLAQDWQAALGELGERLNVDIRVSAGSRERIASG